MASISSNFEALASGTTPTTSNTNFNNITIGAGNTLTTDGSVTRGGYISSLKFAPAGAVSSFCNWTNAGAGLGAGLQRWGRCYLNLGGAYPASTTALFGFMTSAFGSMMSVRITGSTHRLGIYNAAGTNVVTGAVNVPVSGWVRVEWMVNPLGTATGVASVDMYYTNPDGTTPDDSISTSTGNFGTIAPGLYFAGINNAVASAYNVSNLAFSDAAALGPDITSVNYTATQDDPAGLADFLSPLTTADWSFTHAVTIG